MKNKKVIFMGNNFVGYHILNYLLTTHTTLVGAVLHPVQKRKYGAEMEDLLLEHNIPIFDGSLLKNADVQQQIQATNADIALSLFFGYILSPEVISLFPEGVVNLHPSYLPYNRGAHPNIWSIVEGTPAGVTLHYIDNGVDTGNIIAQKQIPVQPVDTGKSLYHRLEIAAIELFQAQWSAILSGTHSRHAQIDHLATVHRMRDRDHLAKIDLNQQYLAKDLINILRALTFPPYPGAYFEHEGKRVYLSLELQAENGQS